jgi:hypothetical protein
MGSGDLDRVGNGPLFLYGEFFEYPPRAESVPGTLGNSFVELKASAQEFPYEPLV